MPKTKWYQQVVGRMLLLATAAPAIALAAPFDVPSPIANNVDVFDTSPTVINFSIAETGTINSLGARIALDNSGDGGLGHWDNVHVQLSHRGIDVVLMDPQLDAVGPIASLDATFSDGGGDLAAAAVANGVTSGTFNPVQALSAFNGQPLEGQWTVTIWDDTHPNDGTDLSAFSIFGNADAVVAAVAPAAPEAIPTMPLFGLSLSVLGLVLLARRALSVQKSDK